MISVNLDTLPVFQYNPVSLGVEVATNITQAVGIHGANGNSVNFTHMWVGRDSNRAYGLVVNLRQVTDSHDFHLRYAHCLASPSVP